jgi:SAM-dependent methyltransferase
MNHQNYVIRGGLPGRERLRLLSRVLEPTTTAFLDRAGLRQGMTCLDVGCGGGDVTFEIARRAGPAGSVVGLDIDPVKIDLAQAEARELGLTNLEFKLSDIAQMEMNAEFDFVYSRFLLTHLKDPARALRALVKALKPGGVIVIEDIDFRGHFCFPESEAFVSYVSLYTEVVRRNGGDANIGARLPQLLRGSGCGDIALNIVQPVGLEGEVKLLVAITMENVGESILKCGLATAGELAQIGEELYSIARDASTLMSGPRVVQLTGTRTAGES